MTLIALLILAVVLLSLAYVKTSLIVWVVTTLVFTTGYAFAPQIGEIPTVVAGALAAALLLVCIIPLRRAALSKPLFIWFQKVLPALSETEQEALNAGTVWWDAELFCGKLNWKKLLGAPKPQLSAASSSQNRLNSSSSYANASSCAETPKRQPQASFSYQNTLGA